MRLERETLTVAAEKSENVAVVLGKVVRVSKYSMQRSSLPPQQGSVC